MVRFPPALGTLLSPLSCSFIPQEFQSPTEHPTELHPRGKPRQWGTEMTALGPWSWAEILNSPELTLFSGPHGLEVAFWHQGSSFSSWMQCLEACFDVTKPRDTNPWWQAGDGAPALFPSRSGCAHIAISLPLFGPSWGVVCLSSLRRLICCAFWQLGAFSLLLAKYSV